MSPKLWPSTSSSSIAERFCGEAVGCRLHLGAVALDVGVVDAERFCGVRPSGADFTLAPWPSTSSSSTAERFAA